jgi:alcohol dehydrogenase class IV
MDALVHAIEAYTSRRSSPFGDLFAERAIPLIGASLAAAYRNGQDRVARYRMALASVTAGIAASMNGVGAVHALTYPLSTAAQITHGLANALLLPHVVAFNLVANPTKYCQIARLLGESVEPLPIESGARRLPPALEALRSELSMPSRLRDVGVMQESFEAFADYAFDRFQGNLEANAHPITRAEALAIYRAAW